MERNEVISRMRRNGYIASVKGEVSEAELAKALGSMQDDYQIPETGVLDTATIQLLHETSDHLM